ncbi:zinc-binding dehydrogenase [Litorilinea aerophila]|uniref:Zinc-binding dehydrogenase n=1 Tax=Litorilinea aerophila TaxID=1204385 RepID=A0A540VKE9_9CHLR|nr:zinc-binding dehydrogenase [Litorilinea aerophila]MCC9075295.1 zinc-binding dehydrogenase [Litorilinea aerophila]GIV79324.1 MAG: Zn-dependent alcohol dehydrogenase [Litorilinea sp.]
MQALVKFGNHDGDVEIREVPEPRPGPGQVLLEVKAAGVCGSDLHMWRENHSWAIKLPLILGHEFCGVVAEVGEGVTGFQVGDRVACETAAAVCGQCVYCLSGNYNLCPHRLGYGALADGAFTRYVVARPQILHRIPDNVPFEHAALTEPICVAYNALVEKTAMKPGDLVVIQGPGPIGIMALQIARLRGAGTLVVLGTDVDQHRLEVAEELGAHYVLNIQRDDPVALIRSLGDGFGADLVVDCTGVSRALQQSLELVRPNGRITKIGWGPQPLDFSLDPLVGKAVTLQGSFSHTYPTWERALGLLSTGQINLGPVIGGVYPLTEWEEAFHAMERGDNVKSVLQISG